TRTTSKLTEEFSSQVRGLSGLVALTRRQPIEDHIHMIEYLMGRRADMPAFLTDVTKDADASLPVTDIVQNMRRRLGGEKEFYRTMIADAFLAGPSSPIETQAEMDKLLSHVMKNIKPDNLELSKTLAGALLRSTGHSKSLALAYIFAQKAEGAGGGELTESEILRSLFEAYGVAGIKLGQYMAFSSELSDYQKALASLQDSASPLSYFEMLQLVNKRFGGQWPQQLKIVKVMGSGSVNVAIQYWDENDKRHEVVSLSRDEIEIATKEDFRRLELFVQELIATPGGDKKYGYISGLLKVIQKSVELEFNKENARRVQNSALKLYRRQMNGWTFKTLEVYDLKNMGLFMEMGTGSPASKVFNKNREVYSTIMPMMGRIELDVLFGIDESGRPHPVPLLVNPDFHDGQVLIDEATKTVTILDFGQALEITNKQREAAVELLRVITKAQSLSNSVETLNFIFQEMTGVDKDVFSEADLKPIWDRTERMDVFIRVLSMMEGRGFNVPLQIVNWVLAVNRQIVLGEKVGVNVEGQIKNLLRVRAVGLGLETYNRARLLHRSMRSLFERAHSIRTRAPRVFVGSCKALFY
ncbi:MAG: hypothetical protein ABL958_12410, partial [Bdellovibrionia bacterium]